MAAWSGRPMTAYWWRRQHSVVPSGSGPGSLPREPDVGLATAGGTAAGTWCAVAGPVPSERAAIPPESPWPASALAVTPPTLHGVALPSGVDRHGRNANRATTASSVTCASGSTGWRPTSLPARLRGANRRQAPCGGAHAADLGRGQGRASEWRHAAPRGGERPAGALLLDADGKPFGVVALDVVSGQIEPSTRSSARQAGPPGPPVATWWSWQ
jgi:hypothetical protein